MERHKVEKKLPSSKIWRQNAHLEIQAPIKGRSKEGEEFMYRKCKRGRQSCEGCSPILERRNQGDAQGRIDHNPLHQGLIRADKSP